jgi:toxin YoeB
MDRTILKRVNRLIDDIARGDPFEGIGKPEPLRHNLAGAWSRRITDEHRLVYVVDDDLRADDTAIVTILTCRYHYEK